MVTINKEILIPLFNLSRSRLCIWHYFCWANCNLEMLVFEERVAGEKFLGSKERTNNKQSLPTYTYMYIGNIGVDVGI